MTTFTPFTNAGEWIGYQILVGAGRGLAIQTVCPSPFILPVFHLTNTERSAQPIVALQEGLPKEDFAVAAATVTVSQYLGGSLCVSIAQSIFRNKLVPALMVDAPSVNPQAIVDAGAYGFARIVPPQVLAGVIGAYNDALRQTFVSHFLYHLSIFGRYSWRITFDRPIKQFLPVATCCLAFFLSFGLGWQKIGIETKDNDEDNATELADNERSEPLASNEDAVARDGK